MSRRGVQTRRGSRLLASLPITVFLAVLAASASADGDRRGPGGTDKAGARVAAGPPSGVISGDRSDRLLATPPPGQADPLSAAIMKALDRSTGGLRVLEIEGGGTGVDLDGRFLHVMGVTVRPGGDFETWCVDHRHGAEKFLGPGALKSWPAEPAAVVLGGPAAAKANAVNATLAIDPTRRAGADELGRVLLYTPNPLEPGSSVSHWDLSAAPDLLMEPTASPAVPFGEVDLTLSHFRDIGWPAGTSSVTIRVKDAADTGFNDPTEVPLAPANPGGTTLGGQRLAALQWAADVWAALLGSAIEINVDSEFDELDCDPDEGAVLAAAGARFLFADFTNAPRGGTWYPGALAEALAGENLSSTENGRPPNTGDIIVNFNSSIDEGCLAPTYRYYYGLDGNTPAGQASFAMVALHELAHGLGFASFVDSSTGSLPSLPGAQGLPDIYTVFAFDPDLGLHWNVMSDEQRLSSAVNTGRLAWDGPATVAAAPQVLENAPRLRISAPSGIAGSYAVQTAQFGPPVDLVGVTGELAVVRDGSDAPNLGCEALVNADEIAGRIAVVDRGSCFFTEKVKNAQNVGAVAVLVVNNLPQGLPPMGGDDPSITIPSVGISQADGTLIKKALGLNTPSPRRGGRRAVPAVIAP
ncbi:MAG TPA: PA domain-containing protein [Chondromyces sp.]|nr:PA domain-containing protein [Chondromyces sp.]